MTDPMAYAVRWVPLGPQWILGACGANSRLIQSVVEETSIYAQAQSDLGLAACRGALRASSLADWTAIEIGFMAGSFRLALGAAGRVASMAADARAGGDSLPIE